MGGWHGVLEEALGEECSVVGGWGFSVYGGRSFKWVGLQCVVEHRRRCSVFSTVSAFISPLQSEREDSRMLRVSARHNVHY